MTDSEKKTCANCYNKNCSHSRKYNQWVDDVTNVCDSHTTEEMQKKLDKVNKRAGLEWVA